MKPSSLIRIFVLSILAWAIILCIGCSVCKAASIWPDTLKIRDTSDYYIVKAEWRLTGKAVGDTAKAVLDTTWAKLARIEFTKGITLRLTPKDVEAFGGILQRGLVGLPADTLARKKFIEELVKVK